MRVDAGLSRLLGMSRTVVAALAEDGRVAVDGRSRRQVRPAGRRVVAGGRAARAARRPRRSAGPVEVVAGLTVLYADDDIVVVDKPVGVAAHPSPGWTGPTVVGGLAALGYRLSTSGAGRAAGHRAPPRRRHHRGDGGGRRPSAPTPTLKRAFKERTVDKRYHAVCQGHPDPSSGTIDAPIDRHPTPRLPLRRRGRRAGPSVTHYDTVEAFRAASLLDIRLETGRTHQIRVHLSALRHPCVGDLTYGADPTLAAPARADPAVAARPRAGLRPPRRRPVGGVHQPVPGRPGARAGPLREP